jgi:hypothetical protein
MYGAGGEPLTMAVHTISLGAAILLLLVALLLLWVIGPFALLILVQVAVLFWYAFGPGSRQSLVT